MKYKIVCIIILFCTILCYNFSEADLTDGLVGFYPFNGNANDESANDAHGLVMGAQLCQGLGEEKNGAYWFDGLDDYIKAPADFLPNDERTVSVWFFGDSDTFSSIDSDNKLRTLLGYGGGLCGSS